MQDKLNTTIAGALAAIAGMAANPFERLPAGVRFAAPSGKEARKLRRQNQRARIKAGTTEGVSGKLAKKAAQGELGIARPVHA